MNETIIKRSDEIWDWSCKHKRKLFYGFKEIRKLEDLIKLYGYQYTREIIDGGLTIVMKHDNGKQLIKAREDCYSEGAVFDLLEVYGVYGENGNLHGYISANEAFSMFLNTMRLYDSKQKIAV